MSPVLDAYVDALLDPGAPAEPLPAAVAAPAVPVAAAVACAVAPPAPDVPAVDAPAAALSVAKPPVAAVPAPRRADSAAAVVAPTRSQAPETPVRAASRSSTHRWLRVAVGGDSYAIELLRVQEVGRTAPIVAMRGAAPCVLGAMNLRGRIVPVLDLGLWLGTARSVDPSMADERTRIVVVERDNELIGALVSAVDDVVTLGPDGIEPPLAGGHNHAIVGVARIGAKPTVLLDAMALFG